MWSAAAAGDGQSATVVQRCSGASRSAVDSTLTVSDAVCCTPVQLVVVEPPPDDKDVHAVSNGSNNSEYPWALTYRRLRRASAMM